MTIGHKSDTAIGKNGKNENKLVKIAENQGKITRVWGIFLRLMMQNLGQGQVVKNGSIYSADEFYSN